MLIDHMTKYFGKMATTLQNKINELEARLRAENESRANDPMIGSLSDDKPSPRRPSPFNQHKSGPGGNITAGRRGPTSVGGQLRPERTASPGAPPIPPRRRIQSPSVARTFTGNETFNQTIDLPQSLSQTVPYVNTRQQHQQRSVSVERSSFTDTQAYYRHTRAGTASQTGSGIPVSSARGRLFSANSDASNRQSKRTQLLSGGVSQVSADKGTIKSSSVKSSQTVVNNGSDNQTCLGFENNFTDVVDIPKSPSTRPTLVRKKSDLDKPRVDIPPGATYNPQSAKKVIFSQTRNSSAVYDASKTGKSSPRYSNSLKKGSSLSASAKTSPGQSGLDDSFDTSWAKSSLSQSKGFGNNSPKSDAQKQTSGIPRGHLQRSSFEKELTYSYSPGKSGFSQANQHTNSPLRRSNDLASPRTLSKETGSLEKSFEKVNGSDITQEVRRGPSIVPVNGNLINTSSQQDSSGIQEQNSSVTLNSTPSLANVERVHSPKYISNAPMSAYSSFGAGTCVQNVRVNGGMHSLDSPKNTPLQTKNMRPTDMFKMGTAVNGDFVKMDNGSNSINNQSVPVNGQQWVASMRTESPLHGVTPTTISDSAEQVNRPPTLVSDINTNSTIPAIPQQHSQSSPRNSSSKSAIPRPSRPTLNFGAVPGTVANRSHVDLNARNNNHLTLNDPSGMTSNGPIMDTNQRAITAGRGHLGWSTLPGYLAIQNTIAEYGSPPSSHMTSPPRTAPMVTSPPYHALYERQTQSPRSLSSGSPSSVRSQSSTPTPTRPSLNFGARVMTSPGMNLPIRHIPTSVSSCDMSFESPDSPGSLSLPGRPSFIASPSSPGGATLPLRPGSAGTPVPLNFSNPGIMRKKKEFHLPMASGQSRTPDANEIELKYQEIMKRCGILTLDGKRIPTSIHELEHVCDLGHGTCGHVVKMRHIHTGHVMAVKQMRRSGNRDENKRIIMDLDVVVKSHNCPYIVKCIGTFITSTDVWICMELMSTCLEKLLKKLCAPIPEEILGKVAVTTVNALHYLKEEHGVIHRDIKPSNILLNVNGDIKLCDFGISGRLVDSKAKTRSAGCAAYMAPERIDPPDPTRPDYDIRADVWSLGISLVELATGAFPYKNCKTDFEVLTRVLQEDPPVLPPGERFSHDLCSFVWHCLTKDYKKRPKYRELLKHSFIKRYMNTPIDVASWYSTVLQKIGPPTPLTTNPGN